MFLGVNGSITLKSIVHDVNYLLFPPNDVERDSMDGEEKPLFSVEEFLIFFFVFVSFGAKFSANLIEASD